MSSGTDSQRSKVYDAEHAVFGTPSSAPTVVAPYHAKARRHLTEREAQQIADRLTAWLRSKGYEATTPKVEFTNRGTTASAFPTTGRLRMQHEWPLLWVLCHEMAHLVTGLPSGDRNMKAWHHAHQFCAVYLVLVRHELGTAAHDDLRNSMKAHRARYTPPRARREVTPERRAELAARLAASRPAPSPHRWGYVRKPNDDLGPAVAVELAERRNLSTRRFAEDLGYPDGFTGPVYASTRLHDYVCYRHDAGYLITRYGTIDPERAVTRTTVEALERWAKSNAWFQFHPDSWVLVDLAAITEPALAVC